MDSIVRVDNYRGKPNYQHYPIQQRPALNRPALRKFDSPYQRRERGKHPDDEKRQQEPRRVSMTYNEHHRDRADAARDRRDEGHYAHGGKEPTSRPAVGRKAASTFAVVTSCPM